MSLAEDFNSAVEKAQILLLSQALSDNLAHLDNEALETLCVNVHKEMDSRGMIDKE